MQAKRKGRRKFPVACKETPALGEARSSKAIPTLLVCLHLAETERCTANKRGKLRRLSHLPIRSLATGKKKKRPRPRANLPSDCDFNAFIIAHGIGNSIILVFFLSCFPFFSRNDFVLCCLAQIFVEILTLLFKPCAAVEA